MEGKICLVTGGTGGIGQETVRGLLKLGAEVVFTARSAKDGEELVDLLKQEAPSAAVSFYVVDLASFTSIRGFVEEFKKTHTKLHVLINNAGVMPHERSETVDGHELNFGVNFLAPVLLTESLLPLLKAAALARIINVSSTMHKEGYINFSDLESKKEFNHYRAYGSSKLALMLWSKVLARELEGQGVTVNALHPGVVRTNLLKEGMRDTNIVVKSLFSLTTISPKEGAETSIYLASSPEVAEVSGEYFVKKKRAETAPQAEDMAVAQKLVNLAREQILL